MTVRAQLMCLVSGNLLNLSFMAVAVVMTGYAAAVARDGSAGVAFTVLLVLGLLASMYSAIMASRTAQRNARRASASPDAGRLDACRTGLLLAVAVALVVGATAAVGEGARSLDLVVPADTVRFSQAVSAAPILTMLVPAAAGYLLGR